MNLTFIHDHVFLKFNGEYYSNGKLTYEQLSYYFRFAKNISVIARFKEVNYDPGSRLKSTGPNVEIFGVKGPLSLSGIIHRKNLISEISGIIVKSDFIISRLPSELGIIGDKIASKLNIPILHEMVASPFDCLWYRGDFFAKCYAPILSFRIKRLLSKASYVIYVTDKYLSKKIPNKR